MSIFYMIALDGVYSAEADGRQLIARANKTKSKTPEASRHWKARGAILEISHRRVRVLPPSGVGTRALILSIPSLISARLAFWKPSLSIFKM